MNKPSHSSLNQSILTLYLHYLLQLDLTTHCRLLCLVRSLLLVLHLFQMKSTVLDFLFRHQILPICYSLSTPRWILSIVYQAKHMKLEYWDESQTFLCIGTSWDNYLDLPLLHPLIRVSKERSGHLIQERECSFRLDDVKDPK